jgi:Protein of unknown function (DUF1194)
MRIKRVLSGLIILCSTLLCAVPALPEDEKIDLALALAIDCSFSVDSDEHRLQMQGFAAALQSEEVLTAIKHGTHQRIALSVYQWSDANNQRVIVPWTIVHTQGELEAVAKVLARGRRDLSEGGTAMSAALIFGAGLFLNAPMAERKVIDLATDGRNNIGQPVNIARDFVLGQGIAINGLAITNEWKQLDTYLERQVIGGTLSFVEKATNYDNFGAAMLRKLVKEITGPGST